MNFSWMSKPIHPLQSHPRGLDIGRKKSYGINSWEIVIVQRTVASLDTLVTLYECHCIW